eukprot:CAMPEP_0178739928 /NCGR_PEP_ID=MMETSP0744-20121128/4319_1 /TAXON_ID=913974 /ORGANISM="Nitzschia punctata, Strain CCMP561" /LENGTH=657 /DNA_ID=CAMNT_0020392669 /DNA_START=545 /DNA_END=2516 /DNA_ORIENTATION=+
MTSSPFLFQENQPDGQTIDLQIHGDAYDSWMSDTAGYTVLQGGLRPSTEIVENQNHNGGDAKFSKKQGKRKADKSKPSKKKKSLRPSKHDCRNKICEDMDGGDDKGDGRRDLLSRLTVRGKHESSSQHQKKQVDHLISESLLSFQNDTKPNGTHRSRFLDGTATTTLRNLVVLLQWSDHVNRTLPSRKDIEVLMNHQGPHLLCPTGSVRDVMLENSYNALSLESTVTDWVVMNNTELYYSNGNRGLTRLFWNAIYFALQVLDDNSLVDFDYFDENKDGKIDSITFLHSGHGAEFGGTDEYGAFYMDRIWSHKWGMYQNPFVSKSGIMIKDYHISSSLWGLKGTGIGRVGVIAHETGHFLGLPDLYDVNGGGRGIGSFGLMSNAWGWDGTQYFPPHMSAWAKFALGWLTPLEPVPGTNHIEASAVQNPTHPQLYLIKEGFPEGEFLLIENRQRIGYDRNMPDSGLLVWHIDYGLGSERDFRKSLMREGYPGQTGWPENNNHYGVALLQADGLYELERGINVGDREDFFHGLGVDKLTPCLNPDDCHYPNTDSYQGGVVVGTNVYITGISSSGNIMSFEYHVGPATDTPSAFPSMDPSFPPSLHPSVALSVMPTTLPSLFPTIQPSEIPSLLPTTEPPSKDPSLSPSETSSSTPSLCTC